MSKLSENIKNRRIQLNLTQEELATRLGYKSRSSINKIELGINDISQRQIAAFAKALNTTPAVLLGLENEKNDKDINKLIILGRNGKREEFILTDEEMEAYEKIFQNRDKYRNNNDGNF